MNFSERANITEQIEQCFEERGGRILVLYGEKGLGKTTLLLQLAETYESVYYHAVPASELQQAHFMLRQFQEERVQPDAKNVYDAVFTALAEHHKQPRVLLMIDESEHILKAGEQFTSALRLLLNHGYSDTDFLVLLSCSSLSFIANSLGKRLGGCAAFIRGIHKLSALSFSDTCTYLEGRPAQECFPLYALLGGNPSFLDAARDCFTTKQLVCSLFLEKKGTMREYGLTCLSGELREFGVYSTILYTVARGKQKLNDIHLATGFSRAKISVYLKNLMELDLIEKVYSYGAGPRDDSKKGLYRILNPALEFWYRFLFAEQSALISEDAEAFYEKRIQPQLQPFWERAYARAVAQALLEGRVWERGHIVRCEEWIGKSGEIPIVAITRQEEAIPVFVHYGTQPLNVADTEWYAFCCKKARLTSKNMIIFSEDEQDEAVHERAHVMSLFSLFES
ncbi:MAG: AAA family ATPase [Lachnospiraceae bacterium]|nr:AAA family ATPase [Lachnospiraceae bacterium]